MGHRNILHITHRGIQFFIAKVFKAIHYGRAPILAKDQVLFGLFLAQPWPGNCESIDTALRDHRGFPSVRVRRLKQGQSGESAYLQRGKQHNCCEKYVFLLEGRGLVIQPEWWCHKILERTAEER